GYDRRHLPGRSGEGRFAFLRIESGEPARGPGPHIDEPSAAAELFDDRVDRRAELVSGGGHGRGHDGVLSVDEPEQLPRRQLVVVGVLEQSAFRNELVEPEFVGLLARCHARSLSWWKSGGQYHFTGSTHFGLVFRRSGLVCCAPWPGSCSST